MAQKLHFELYLSYHIPLLKLLDCVSLSIAQYWFEAIVHGSSTW